MMTFGPWVDTLTSNESLLFQINKLMEMLRCECCHGKAVFLYRMTGPLCQECFEWIFVEKHEEESLRTFASRAAYLQRKQKEIAK